MVPTIYSENWNIKDKLKEVKTKEEGFFNKFKSLNLFFNSWKDSKRKEILDLVNQYGPLPAKAFPGRAAILIELLKFHSKYVCVSCKRSIPIVYR